MVWPLGLVLVIALLVAQARARAFDRADQPSWRVDDPVVRWPPLSPAAQEWLHVLLERGVPVASFDKGVREGEVAVLFCDGTAATVTGGAPGVVSLLAVDILTVRVRPEAVEVGPGNAVLVFRRGRRALRLVVLAIQPPERSGRPRYTHPNWPPY